MLQTAPFRGLGKREAVHLIDYFHALFADFNLFDQHTNHLLFRGPVRLFQAPLQLSGKRFDLAHDELEVLATVLFCGHGRDLLLELLLTLASGVQPGLELRAIDQPVLVRVDQTADAPLELLRQGSQRVHGLIPVRPGQTSLVFAGEPLGLSQ